MLNRHARLSIIGMGLLVTMILAAFPDAAIGESILLFSGGNVTQITNNGRSPAINDLGHLVWKTSESNICYYNGSIHQVTNSYSITPDINNSNSIVFRGSVDGKGGICLYAMPLT